MDIFFFSFIILLAAILQTSTGFGFSIFATPFLLLLFTPNEAIQINLILSFLISLTFFTKIKQDVETSIVRRFIVGSSVGVFIGIMIFLFLDVAQLKIIIGLIILILTCLLIFQFRVRKSARKDRYVGVISGALTTGIGMPGPPLLLYFSGTDTNKAVLRATTLAFYLYIYVISFFVQFLFAGSSWVVLQASGAAIPLVFIGMFIGQYLFNLLNQRIFQWITYTLLLFTALYLLINA